MIKKLIFLTFFCLFVINGLGILSQKNVFFLTFFLNLWFLIQIISEKKKISFPPEAFFYLMFLIFSIPASFHNQYNRGLSIEGFFFYLNLLIIFIFFFNNKDLSKKISHAILSFTPFIFIFLFLLNTLAGQVVFKDLQISEYNFFLSFYKKHNHLGDLLGLSILYFFFNQKRLLILLFLPFYFLSYSRTAFLALIFVFFLRFVFLMQTSKIREENNRNLLLIKILFFGSLFFFILKTKKIVSFNFENLFIDPRIYYFLTAIKGVFNNPLGIGFYNFGALSATEHIFGTFSSETHNIFLEILLGGGVLSLIFFTIFIFLSLKKIYKNNQENFFLLFYLLVIFSFDYVYNIFFFFIFFFIFLASSLPKENKIPELNKKILILKHSLLLTFFSLFVLSRFFIFQNRLDLALKFYFLDGSLYTNYIQELIRQKKTRESYFYIKKYEKIFPKTFDWLASFYFLIGLCPEAVKYSQKSLNYYALPHFFRLRNVFIYLTRCVSEDYAYKFFKRSYLDKVEKFQNKKDKEQVKKIFKSWCINDDKFCKNILGEKVFYFHPKPKTKEKSNFPIKAIYNFNNEGFNERFDYQIKKEKDVFRILVIGDNNAFGFLVNTKDNWAEQLEEKFKFKTSNPKFRYKKIEVINLSYHSYDLEYQVERFRQQGLKYQPDLVIWMNNDFLRINEIFLPLTEKYSWIENNPHEKEKYQKQGQYFPSWTLAYDEYKKKIEKENIDVVNYQKERIKEFFEIYQGKVVFVNLYDIPDWIKEVFLSYQNVYILNPKELFQSDDYYYEKVKAINPKGHQKLAEIIYQFLLENRLLL